MSNKKAPKCNCPGTRKSKSNAESQCCMKQKYWVMLRDKCFSDICFIVGTAPNTQNIHAHRSVLSVGSSVFKTMFSKDWSRKSNKIEIPDVEPAVFYTLLRFIYIEDVQLKEDSVMEVLYAAKKYAVIRLENQCADFLSEQLSPDNACSLLSQAKLFDLPKLVESCLEEIDDNPESVLSSDSFTSIDLSLLRLILARDSLQINEVDLFDGVLRWTVAECQRKNLAVNADNQKLVLEGATSLIRFPVMTQTEFASKVLPFGLLSNEELVSLFQYFSKIPDISSSFISTPRLSKEYHTASRFADTCYDVSWSHKDGRRDGIGFSFDHDVRLVGFGLYQSNDDGEPPSEDDDDDEEEDETEDGNNDEDKDTEHKVDITVKNEETGDVLYQNFSTHKMDEDEETYNVLLKKSIKLTANTLYAVITKIQGPASLYGEGGETNICVEDSQRDRKVNVTFKKVGYEGSRKRTDVNRGQIPEILFKW